MLNKNYTVCKGQPLSNIRHLLYNLKQRLYKTTAVYTTTVYTNSCTINNSSYTPRQSGLRYLHFRDEPLTVLSPQVTQSQPTHTHTSTDVIKLPSLHRQRMKLQDVAPCRGDKYDKAIIYTVNTFHYTNGALSSGHNTILPYSINGVLGNNDAFTQG